MKLTSEAVSDIMKNCLSEVECDDASVKVVQGIVYSYAFKKSALLANAAKITDLLKQLPTGFMASQGGGMSFIYAAMDKDDNQWGEQCNAEQLMCLGLAIDKVGYCLPREFWSALPGGVPYFYVKGE